MSNPVAIAKGWSPELAVVVDGERRVLQVVDWFGGTNDKPTTGQYLGQTGFVFVVSDATDIRGAIGPQELADDNGQPGDV